MGGFALVVGEELVDGDDVHGHQVHACGVDHHGRVDALEGAPLGQEHLAAAALLGGRPHDDDPPAELLRERRGGEAGAQARRGDDVVPAAVADLGQRVVLAQDGDGGALRTGPRHEGGVDAERAGARPRGPRPRGSP